MTALILSPRDGMFLKDGREWATADGGRAHSLGWPMPSTLFGTLVTARGRLREAAGAHLTPRDWQALPAETRLDAAIALRRPVSPAAGDWNVQHRVWPVPADALFLASENGKPKEVLRLDPWPSTCPVLSRDDDRGPRALWWPRIVDQAKPAAAPQWWSEGAFIEWLAVPQTRRPCTGEFRGLSQPRQVQTHVGIDPHTRAARESVLFAHDTVETLDAQRCEWVVGCRADLGGELPVHATLGGDRRLAGLAIAPEDLFAMPAELDAAFKRNAPRGLRLVAITPAIFAKGWLPDGFAAHGDGLVRGRLPDFDAELVLRAAFVPRPAHVSGWDMALGRPKPTTRLVPPGAVYHFEKSDGGDFSTAEAAALWLVVLGERAAQGFGRFVPGVWQPQEDGR